MDLDPERQNVWRSYGQLLGELETVFARMKAEFQAEVKCRQGCDDCCSAPFRVSLIEAIVLSTALRRLDRRVRREVLRRAKKTVKAAEKLFTGLPNDPTRASRLVSRERSRCPLLGDDGCLLYPVRPTTCRLYGLPTQSSGQAHTCPKSGFGPGRTYPTVDLGQVTGRLAGLSLVLAGLDGRGDLATAPVTVARAILTEYPKAVHPD